MSVSEVYIPFDLPTYLQDPTKLRGRDGSTPSFQAYSAPTDNLYLEWPINTELHGVTVVTNNSGPMGPNQLSQSQLRGYLRISTSVPTVSYAVALVGGGSFGPYRVVLADSSAAVIVVAALPGFVRWLVTLTAVSVA